VVVDAPRIEPVSSHRPKFPEQGDLQGISPNLALQGHFWRSVTEQIQWVAAEIPYATEQGIYEGITGNFFRITEESNAGFVRMLAADRLRHQ
jgi:hypothetical protein